MIFSANPASLRWKVPCDRCLIGNYLRNRDNLFAQMNAALDTLAFFQALPADGGDSQAGKAIVRQITAAARAQLERLQQARDTQRVMDQGASHDNR